MAYKILNPNPNVVRKYQEADFIDQYFVSAHDRTEMQFFLTSGNVSRDPKLAIPMGGQMEALITEATDDPTRPITRTINKVHRIQVGAKEYLFYSESLMGSNFHTKQKISHNRLVGKYQDVEFDKRWNEKTQKIETVDVNTRPIVYDIEFKEEFIDPSTGEKTTLQALGQYLSATPEFEVWSPGRRYTVAVPYDEFISRKFEDLVEYGKYGKFPEPKKDESKRGKQ